MRDRSAYHFSGVKVAWAKIHHVNNKLNSNELFECTARRRLSDNGSTL